MRETITYLTFREIKRLKHLIDTTVAAGLPLAHIYQNHSRYTRHHVSDWLKIFTQNPDYLEQTNQIRRALVLAKRQGKTISDILGDFPDINEQKIYRANRDLGIFPIKQTKIRTDAEITEILEYAAEHGTNAAARCFSVGKANIVRWNKIHKKYTPQQNPVKLSDEKASEILQTVCNYRTETDTFGGARETADANGISVTTVYTVNRDKKIFETKKYETYDEDFIVQVLNAAEQFNKQFKTRGGVRAVSEKYGISTNLVYKWNLKRKIIETMRYCPDTLLDQAAIDIILAMAEQSKTVLDVAKATGHDETTIKKTLMRHGYTCNFRGIHR